MKKIILNIIFIFLLCIGVVFGGLGNTGSAVVDDVEEYINTCSKYDYVNANNIVVEHWCGISNNIEAEVNVLEQTKCKQFNGDKGYCVSCKNLESCKMPSYYDNTKEPPIQSVVNQSIMNQSTINNTNQNLKNDSIVNIDYNDTCTGYNYVTDNGDKVGYSCKTSNDLNDCYKYEKDVHIIGKDNCLTENNDKGRCTACVNNVKYNYKLGVKDVDCNWLSSKDCEENMNCINREYFSSRVCDDVRTTKICKGLNEQQCGINKNCFFGKKYTSNRFWGYISRTECLANNQKEKTCDNLKESHCEKVKDCKPIYKYENARKGVKKVFDSCKPSNYKIPFGKTDVAPVKKKIVNCAIMNVDQCVKSEECKPFKEKINGKFFKQAQCENIKTTQKCGILTKNECSLNTNCFNGNIYSNAIWKFKAKKISACLPNYKKGKTCGTLNEKSCNQISECAPEYVYKDSSKGIKKVFSYCKNK